VSTVRNGTRPFWLHQLVEYILGITLVSQALQSPTPAVPAVAGGAMLVNAAVARGPLSAFRLVGRRVHRTLDVVVMALTAGLAVQPWIGIDPGARIIMLGIAAVHAFVWWQSDLSEPAPRATRSRPAAPAPAASAPKASKPATPAAPAASAPKPAAPAASAAPVSQEQSATSASAAATGSPTGTTPTAPPSSAAGDRSTEVGRAAGRAVGAGVRAMRRWTRP
jgi:hypothetical protein